MTLLEMKKKVLQLIEEIDTSQTSLTSDPDIATKINSVINQVQFEVARIKKIPAVSEEEVTASEIFELDMLDNFYQLRLIRFQDASGNAAGFEIIDNMVLFSTDGNAKIFYYKFPKTITDTTTDDYKFELAKDALEVIPYGVAADLLKSDVSTEYGAIYSQRYETMLQRLDPRYSVGSISVEGGVDI